MFNGWGARIGAEIEVWAAQPRARGMRFNEAPLATVDAMVEEYLAALRPSVDMPYAFYGHSLGGLVAFELTRRLEAQGTGPVHLFIGASTPPHLGLLHEEIGHLADGPFVEAIQERYAGIPAVVLEEPDLLAMFLPALKADFAAYEKYSFRRTGPVKCPMTVFAGADDAGIAPHIVEEWERHAGGGFAMHTVPGDHFFLTESAGLVLGIMRNCLESGEGSTRVAMAAADEA